MASSQVAGGDSILAAKINELTSGSTQPSSPAYGNLWMDWNTVPPVLREYDALGNFSLAAIPAWGTFTASGDIIFGTGIASYSTLPRGSNGQLLRMNGGTLRPEWYTPVGAAVPAVASAAGSPGVSTVFSRDDHSHPDNVLSANSAGTGFAVGLASVPGFGGVCRIVVTVGNNPGSAITVRVNGLATAIYTVGGSAGQTGVAVNVGSFTIPLVLDILYVDAGAANNQHYLSIQPVSAQGSSSPIAAVAALVAAGVSVNVTWANSVTWSFRAQAG